MLRDQRRPDCVELERFRERRGAQRPPSLLRLKTIGIVEYASCHDDEIQGTGRFLYR
jgi:hypothetical protein